MVRGDFLDRLAATDRFYSDLGLELGTVGAAPVQFLRRRLRLCWEAPSEAVPRLRGERWGLSRKTRPPQIVRLAQSRPMNRIHSVVVFSVHVQRSAVAASVHCSVHGRFNCS